MAGGRLPEDALTTVEIEALLRACSRRAPTGIRNARQVLDFYALVVQDLKPWQPRPQQLTQTPEPPPTAESNLLPIPMAQVSQPSLTPLVHGAADEDQSAPPHHQLST